MYWKSDTTGWKHGTHDNVITITQAARLTGMHPDTLRAAVRRGENVGFPIFKAGRRYTVPKRPLYNLLGITE
jgi:hypothetical protein